MIFHQVDAGGDRNFAYIIADRKGGRAALVDPPPNEKRYANLLDRDDLSVDYVIITHGHGDHTWGIATAIEKFQCKTVGHKSILLDIDVPVDDGDSLRVGELELSFIYTPGHSDDHICILCQDKLITGDLLFVGKVGGTDLGEGARKEYHSLHHKIMVLDPAIEVYPGHNFGVSPTSTIGHEAASNPFIQQKTFKDFLDLKMHWLQYKRKHGIK